MAYTLKRALHEHKRAFIAFALLTTILNLSDIFSTYYVTPDLRFEGNPIVRKLNLGWNGFLLLMFAYLIWYILLFTVFIYSNWLVKQRIATQHELPKDIYVLAGIKKGFKLKDIFLIGMSIITYCLSAQYIAIKATFTVDNFLAGLHSRHSRLVSVTPKKYENYYFNETLVEIDTNDAFWQTWIGKIVQAHSTLGYVQKHEAFETFFAIVAVSIALIWLVRFYKWFLNLPPRLGSCLHEPKSYLLFDKSQKIGRIFQIRWKNLPPQPFWALAFPVSTCKIWITTLLKRVSITVVTVFWGLLIP